MKNNQKCVRLSDETLQKIEAWDGNGFNQKLENMIEFCFNRRAKEIEKVNRLIKRRDDLAAEVEQLAKVKQTVHALNSYQKEIEKYIKSAPVPGQMTM
jgi:DNA anti-recombination protein RmuC